MPPRLVVLSAVAGLVLGASLGCGGSSSETPPPLEPTPANVHYDRSATTLPGELGSTEPDGGAGDPPGGGSPSEAPGRGRERGAPER
jgi:hypothetical protein